MAVADFEPVIGLEVHAQLLTRSKIFCGCSTQFGAPPNTQVCPVCLGLPGALPALNSGAVEMAIKAGKAFGCRIAERSIWARKNYFYPDLPKGYQISQYELPICSGGAVPVPGLGKIGLERIHLEEDAGKNIHAEGGSEVDLNRSGVPLIEGGGKVAQETRLFDNEKGVTRPMRSKEEANDYRYFPEPDLPPLLVSRELLDSVTVPKLPQEVVEMLGAAGVPAADARAIVSDPRLVEVHRRIGVDAKRAALFVVGELARAVNENEADLGALKFDPALVPAVWKLQDSGAISSTAAKEVLAELIRTGEAPEKIVERKGLAQVSDTAALEVVVDAVIARTPAEVEKYKAGKTNLLGFFVGQAMKELKGKGNPGALNALFKKKLG